MPDFPDQDALIATPGTNLGAAPNIEERGRIALDFVSDLRRDFEKRDKLFKQIDQVIFMEQAVKIPENFKATAVEVRTPLALHIANSITAALSINTPKVHFKPIEFGDPGWDAAAYRERFFEASWRRQQREKRRNIYRLFMYDVVNKGYGVLKTNERTMRAWAKYTPYAQALLKDLDGRYDAGEIDEDTRSRIYDGYTEEYKRALPYPIETTEIPPETFYYQQGEDGFVRVAEIKAVPYYSTLKKYNAGLNESGKVVALDDVAGRAMPSEAWGGIFEKKMVHQHTIDMVELWDVDKCTIILRGPGDIGPRGRAGSGLVVREYKHKYGNQELGVLDGPYFAAPGILTSSREPHKAHLSVIFAYMHLFPLLNSLLTMQSQAAFSFAYPAYRRTTPPAFGLPDHPFGLDAVDVNASREPIVPGAIFPHDVGPMDQPRTSVDLDKAISFVRSLIDMALPDSVQGVITGETAGYALNQAAHLASLQWSPIIDNVQSAMSDRTSWESRLIEEFVGEPVWVWGAIPQPKRRSGMRTTYKEGWMSIGPQQLKGVHNYEVELKPANVNNDTLELRVIEQELNLRLISPSMAVAKRGENPVEVERDWLLHELKQDPEIRKNMKQRIFFNLSTVDQESMRQVGPEGQPGGAPPAPMTDMQVNVPQGVAPGISPEAFVPPFGAQPGQVPPPPPVGGPGPGNTPEPPGPPAGAPSGIPGPPSRHAPIPGG